MWEWPKCSVKKQKYFPTIQKLCADIRPSAWRAHELTFPLVYDGLHHHGENLFVHVEQQLWGESRILSAPDDCLGRAFRLSADRAPAAYLLVGPLAEVDGVWRQTELLAHSPLEVHRLRLQGAVLRQVTAGGRAESVNALKIRRIIILILIKLVCADNHLGNNCLEILLSNSTLPKGDWNNQYYFWGNSV